MIDSKKFAEIAQAGFSTAQVEANRIAQDQADTQRRLTVQAAEAAKKLARRLPVLQGIVAAVNQLRTQMGTGKHVAALNESTGSIAVDNVEVRHYLSIDEEMSHTGSRFGRYNSSTPTGKLRVSVRERGGNVNYPQRKDGTHNYAEIALRLAGIAHRGNEELKMQAARKSNEAIAIATWAALGVSEYGTFAVSPSMAVDKPVFVKFKVERAMTVEEATALHAALAALGYVK